MKLGFFIGLALFFAPVTVFAAPTISTITDSGQTGKYEKFEITASINTSAQSMFFPYDTTAVAGLTPGLGVSVDGLFTLDNWTTVYKQPGFYFVEYSENGSLYYPTGNTFWKVRFAPNKTGNWQYKISVKDASGTVESQPKNFTVVDSANHGFVQVSKNDSRYFEFSDGTYFPGLGVNDFIDKNNPANSNATLNKYGSNGIQVLRFWLSNWTIFGSSWTPWESVKGTYNGYLPQAGLITNRAESTSSSPQANLTLVYSEDANGQNSGSWFDACHLSVAGGSQVKIATKPSTTYHIKIKYQARGMVGPRDTRFTDYGFVFKTQNPNNGNWHGFQNPGGECWNGSLNKKDTGVPITGYAGNTTGWTKSGNLWSSPNWGYLESDWVSTGDHTPILYLALENVNNIAPTVDGQTYNWHPYVNIDTIEIREKKGDGTLGPNIVPRWNFSFLEHVDQRNAYAFDKAVEMASNSGVFLKTVILEKNEHIENEIGADGNRAEFNNNNLYGQWRNLTAVRWLQQAWWRYLQARWGYSTAIHSWELVNEGEEINSQHWTATDELAKYMKCSVFGVSVGSADGSKCNYSHPNAHLSTTSFWYGFPGTDFWANSKYPNVDYADVHDYINKPSEPTNYFDTALATYNLGANTAGTGKPVIRGETGLITDNGTDNTSQELDVNGVWLHNFIWGGINQYGLTENWWHLSQIKSNFWPYYKHYYDFIYNVPLNKGGYVDALASATDTNIRVWGQKNTAKGLAHVWVQNKKHIWCAINNTPGCPQTWDGSRLNGAVTISGFTPGTYPVEYWSFDNNVALAKTTGTVTVDGTGNLNLNIAALPSNNTDTDVGIKIGNYNVASVAGDLNGDSKVDILDLRLATKNFNSIFELTTVIANYGQPSP